jgi:hypothetical protein
VHPAPGEQNFWEKGKFLRAACIGLRLLLRGNGDGCTGLALSANAETLLRGASATRQSRVACVALDCRVEPVIGPRFRADPLAQQ